METEKVQVDQQLEGQAAFVRMAKLVLRSHMPKKPHGKYPSCLNDIVERGGQKKYPCTLCGKLFPKPFQLEVHANEHGPEDNPYAECCFCGLSLGDFIRLEMHQLSRPLSHRCFTCLENFSSFNEFNHHSCGVVKNAACDKKEFQTGLVCQLGCSKERHFETEEALELHLYSLHGASMDDDPANHDAMKFCIMCRGFVNAYRLSLEDHTFFRCNGRHPWVKESIIGLYKLSKEQSLNLGMLIQLELESHLEEWKAREAMKGQTTNVIKVPPHVSKNIITKCVGAVDRKYNPNESPFILPPTTSIVGMCQSLNPRKDGIKIFHLWK